MQNLTNTNAHIAQIGLDYSGNPWTLTIVFLVDGNEYRKLINLGEVA